MGNRNEGWEVGHNAVGVVWTLEKYQVTLGQGKIRSALLYMVDFYALYHAISILNAQ